ncbi:hypothetical protein [Sagittula sp. S175]|uniref:hypothetical protein n=1 Tax=Sagittula sp. S175 TaxID=3415129 RepID=UPI003C7DD847
MVEVLNIPLRMALAVSFLLAGVSPANTAPFNDHQIWTFQCVLTNLKREGHLPENETSALDIVWNRDANLARTVTPSGNDKGLTVMSGFAGTAKHSVHFLMSPATAKFTGESTKNGRYGGWIEGLGPTIISIPSDGSVAMTSHSIISGGMKAFSHEGTCRIRGRSLATDQ